MIVNSLLTLYLYTNIASMTTSYKLAKETVKKQPLFLFNFYIHSLTKTEAFVITIIHILWIYIYYGFTNAKTPTNPGPV